MLAQLYLIYNIKFYILVFCVLTIRKIKKKFKYASYLLFTISSSLLKVQGIQYTFLGTSMQQSRATASISVTM
jgi:hypothetical protein